MRRARSALRILYSLFPFPPVLVAAAAAHSQQGTENALLPIVSLDTGTCLVHLPFLFLIPIYKLKLSTRSKPNPRRPPYPRPRPRRYLKSPLPRRRRPGHFIKLRHRLQLYNTLPIFTSYSGSFVPLKALENPRQERATHIVTCPPLPPSPSSRTNLGKVESVRRA